MVTNVNLSLSHLNDSGEAHMVDVTEKAVTKREAIAESRVEVSAKTLEMILSGQHHKGDVFATARIAGIQAAKKTSELIPLCHPLFLSKVEIDISVDEILHQIIIQALCRIEGKTGVEMEALTAASIAALTIYDMCKAVQKDMVIKETRLLKKTGGKSGEFKAKEYD